jgi:hypothetical protein
MNPYAKYLGQSDPIEVIGATAGRLERLLRAMGPERAGQAPAAGKWSAREIVCHLADTEIAFAFRLRQAQAEAYHVIQPFDQEKWGAAYGAYSAETALAAFAGLRAWNLAFLKATPRESFSKKLTHPERGEMTFQVLVETMAGHDNNHVLQIEALAGRSAGA